MERSCGDRGAGWGGERERDWEYNGGGRDAATATTARAALRGGHVARAALSRDGSRGVLGSPPQPTLTQIRETPRPGAPPFLVCLLNRVHARGCDDALMREQSLRLLVARSDGPERSPLRQRTPKFNPRGSTRKQEMSSSERTAEARISQKPSSLSNGVRPRMAETKPELAGIPRATGVSQYVPSGRRHYAPRRDPAARGEAGGCALS